MLASKTLVLEFIELEALTWNCMAIVRNFLW
jgi:hypothetical protein